MPHPERSEGPKTALITGASAGIGWELARVFARHKHDLILVARSADKLRSLADDLKSRHGISVQVIVQDLSVPEGPAQVFNEIRDRKINIEILVNNAGFGTYGFFSETNLEKELELIRLNIAALTHLTKLFLPGMLARKSGKILNVASTAAFQPGPLMAVYYASKAYVLSFSEALAAELSGTGVSVTALCPGPTESEFQKTAGIHEHLLLFKLTMMKSAKVAKIGYAGLMKGKRIVIPGFLNRLLPFGVRLAPRALVTAIVRWIQKSSKHTKSHEKKGKFWFLSVALAVAALAAWFTFQNLDFELWEPAKQADIPAAAAPRVIKIDLNNPEDLASWNRHSFHGETNYEIYEEPDGTKSLKAASENACSALFKPVEVPIAERPVLSWQWKVKKFPTGKISPVFGAKNESDYAARVSVIFKSDLPLQQDIVQYVWDDRFPVGTNGSSPFWKKVKILVVRSRLPAPEGTAAPADPEAWVSEKRDITQDYTMLFGKPPGKDIEAIGLMSDSDDTKTSTEAYYRNFEIQTLPSKEDAVKKVRKKKLSIPLAPAFRKTGKVVQTLFKIPSEKISKPLFSTTKKVVSWPVAKAKALGENVSRKEPPP